MNKKTMLFILVFAFLAVVAGYYLFNSEGFNRNSILVGDKVCGNLPSEDGRNACCLNAHKDEVTIACVGQWKYIGEQKQCGFVCEGTLPSCTMEAKLCPDGISVARNASNDCKFDSCPAIAWPKTQLQCEQRGGEWTQLYTLEGPSGQICVLSASDAGKKCTDSSQCEGSCMAPQKAQEGQQTVGSCSNRVSEHKSLCGKTLYNSTVRTLMCE